MNFGQYIDNRAACAYASYLLKQTVEVHVNNVAIPFVEQQILSVPVSQSIMT